MYITVCHHILSWNYSYNAFGYMHSVQHFTVNTMKGVHIFSINIPGTGGCDLDTDFDISASKPSLSFFL